MMGGRMRGVTLCVVGALFFAGCARTFQGSVNQPNPLVDPREVSRASEEVVITTGDMELRQEVSKSATGLAQSERVALTNKAQFTLVSKDRLRFHVQVEHKWPEYTDLTDWEVELLDDRGHRYRPSSVEGVKKSHVVSTWDYETRTVTRDRYGDITSVANDGHENRQSLGSLVLYRGRADLVFYGADIMSRDIKSLTLKLSRATTKFEFTWRFATA